MGLETAVVSDTSWPIVDVHPDPRLSNLCPGWLRGEGWRERLSALAAEDVEWIERQWGLADGPAPDFDLSWVRIEEVRW
jgi:hypothetical protein